MGAWTFPVYSGLFRDQDFTSQMTVAIIITIRSMLNMGQTSSVPASSHLYLAFISQNDIKKLNDANIITVCSIRNNVEFHKSTVCPPLNTPNWCVQLHVHRVRFIKLDCFNVACPEENTI